MERTLLQRNPEAFAVQHTSLTRRYFLQLGTAGLAALDASELWAKQVSDEVLANPLLPAAVNELEYLTPVAKFKAQRRGGKQTLSELPAEKLAAIDRAQEAWKIEVMPDPESDSQLLNPLAKAKGNALDWAGLKKLAEKHAVRFLHVLTCANIPQPDGIGLWEGVPVRDILWLTEPKQNIRRIIFAGYRNAPKQLFQGSLAINRVLEELPGELPVIVCYKLNGQPISQANGGPVRLIVPGAFRHRPRDGKPPNIRQP